MPVKGTTKISRRGKTATIWRGAMFDDVKGISFGRTSESKNGMSSKKWTYRNSSTGLGNPRSGSYNKRKTTWRTGGGF